MTDRHDEAPHGPPAGERAYWLDSKANVDRLVRVFYGICAFLFAIDLFVPKHGHFALEHLFGFYAVFGFVACVALVLAAKALRTVIMRPEDYYDR